MDKTTTQTAVRVGDLQVDSSYQRPSSDAWVRKTAKEFDPMKLGALHVSRRFNGALFVIDGQGRVKLILFLGMPDFMANAVIYEGLSIQEEADIFIGLNEDRAIKPDYKFRAKLTAGYPAAVEINSVINSLGLRIDPASTAPGVVRAIRSIEHVHENLGPEGLRTTIEVLKTVWPDDTRAFGGEIVMGLGMFLHKQSGAVANNWRGMNHLYDKLKATTPNRIVIRAQDRRAAHGGSTAANVSIEIAEVYNKGLRSRRVPVLSARDYSANWRGVAPRPGSRGGVGVPVQQGRLQTVTG